MWFPRVLDSELLRACGAQLHTHNPQRIYLRRATHASSLSNGGGMERPNGAFSVFPPDSSS